MNFKSSILIIEDEPVICDFIAASLEASSYKAIKCATGKEGLSMTASHCPDLVLLDLGLPDMDGLAVLREIRTWSGIPVIVVSARTQEIEKVQALDLGADDYITKPFGTSELMARIRAAIRRNAKSITGRTSSPNLYSSNGLLIDFEKRAILLEGSKVHLTQNEYRLVSLLAKNAGKVLTYEYLITQIWGPNSPNNNQILRVNMANIRRKLESNPADPNYIFTEIGVGYYMAENDSLLSP